MIPKPVPADESAAKATRLRPTLKYLSRTISDLVNPEGYLETETLRAK